MQSIHLRQNRLWPSATTALGSPSEDVAAEVHICRRHSCHHRSSVIKSVSDFGLHTRAPCKRSAWRILRHSLALGCVYWRHWRRDGTSRNWGKARENTSGRLPLGIPGISSALSSMDEPWVEDILCFRVVRACMCEDQKGEHVCVYACARMEVELPVSGSPQRKQAHT